MDTLNVQRSKTSFGKSMARSAPDRLSLVPPPIRRFLASIARALIIAAACLLPTAAVNAQSSQLATYLSIGAPQQTSLGDVVTVQAVLVDSRGTPIPKATIYFTTPAVILNASGDATLAQAVTNKDGQAVAQIKVDASGTLVLAAEFRGDPQFGPANATTQMEVVGEGQVYDEHVGVDIPGFNVPPSFGATAYAQTPMPDLPQLFESLWPAMTAWPIGAALLVVWSLYFVAVTFLFRIAAPEDEADLAPSFPHRWRSP